MSESHKGAAFEGRAVGVSLLVPWVPSRSSWGMAPCRAGCGLQLPQSPLLSLVTYSWPRGAGKRARWQEGGDRNWQGQEKVPERDRHLGRACKRLKPGQWRHCLFSVFKSVQPLRTRKEASVLLVSRWHGFASGRTSSCGRREQRRGKEDPCFCSADGGNQRYNLWTAAQMHLQKLLVNAPRLNQTSWRPKHSR